MAVKRVADVLYGIETYDQLAERVEQSVHRLVDIGAKPLAYVNGGRWLTLCPSCNNGVPVDPTWPKTVCVDCGSVYAPVYPDDPDAIDAALEPRLPANQNWLPGESVDALLAENAAHGIAPMMDTPVATPTKTTSRKRAR